jgi:hypothetical protein
VLILQMVGSTGLSDNGCRGVHLLKTGRKREYLVTVDEGVAFSTRTFLVSEHSPELQTSSFSAFGAKKKERRSIRPNNNLSRFEKN